MIETISSGIDENAGFKLKYIIEGEGFPALVIGSSPYYQRAFSATIKKKFNSSLLITGVGNGLLHSREND